MSWPIRRCGPAPPPIELRPRPLLVADLEDAARLVDLVAERPTLRNRQRGGLLQVDVLARADGVDRDQGVPVIGRADDDGVDILVGEQVTVVAQPGDAVIGLPVTLVFGR